MQSPAEVPVSTAQDSCTLSKDTDLVGGDLPNATFAATNPKDCCAACLATSSCYAWTLSSVQNKCYLKAESGWQLHANDTCCMSGTANREGVIVALPNISPPSINLSGGGLGKKASITNYGNGNPPTFRGPAGSIGSRKLLEQLPFSHNSRNLLQDKASNSSLSGNSSERGYIVASTAPSAELLSPSTAVMQYSDAREKTKFIIDMAVPDKLSQAYGRLESIGFWFGCVFILACAFNFSAWMVVKCRNKETPGVLYVPRMQLILLMSLMPPLAYVGSILLVNKSGVIPLVVGITVVVCGPLLFLTASASGIAVALYRKRKTVYLLSNQYSGQNTMHYSRWELVFVAQVMGMSLNRGKWRPESSRKNEFVFRFGPLFEDCRGKS